MRQMERSKAAKFAASVFYEGFNDFDIYIEDTAPGYAKIVASMFSRAMSSNISLDKVFPLGQRGDVIDAARIRKGSGNLRPAVYVVDGDLYMLAGEREVLPSNVVVLPRYCIENFMLDESAFVEIMDEEHCTLENKQLKQKLDFAGWIARSTDALSGLFKVFAAAHHLCSGIPTVSRGYGAVYSGTLGEVDLAKCNAIAQEIKDLLIQEKGAEAVASALEYVEEKVDSSKCFVRTYVSAKDFTLPLALLRMKAIAPTKIPHINLKLRIAKKCNVSSFDDVVRQISEIVSMPQIIPDQRPSA